MTTRKLGGPGQPQRAGTGRLRTPAGRDDGRERDRDARRSSRDRVHVGSGGPGLLDRPGPQDAGDRIAKFLDEHAAALQGFASSDRRRLRDVLVALGTEDGQQANRSLDDLLQDFGKLADRLGSEDGDDSPLGQIVRDLYNNLGDRLGSDLAGQMSKRQALRDVIRTAARPESIIQGRGTSTCAAAVIQTMLARTDPARYVDMATDLLFDGHTRTVTGHLLRAHTAELRERELGWDTGRGAFNALFQGSLMAYARAEAPAEDGDDFGGGRGQMRPVYGSGYATYGADSPQIDGLTAEQVQVLVHRVLGDRVSSVSVSDSNRDTAFEGLVASLAERPTGVAARRRKEAAASGGPARSGLTAKELGKVAGDVRAGKLSGVPVGVRTSEGFLHEILVLGIEGGAVVYQDPGDGRTKTVPVETFKNDMMSVIVPKGPPPTFSRGRARNREFDD